MRLLIDDDTLDRLAAAVDLRLRPAHRPGVTEVLQRLLDLACFIHERART